MSRKGRGGQTHVEKFGRSGSKLNLAIDPDYFGPGLAPIMCLIIMYIFIIIWGGYVPYCVYIGTWGFIVAYFSYYVKGFIPDTSEEDRRHFAEDDAACRHV